MAEGGENSFVELREEQRGKEEEEEELYMQLKELSVNDNVRKGAKCESCKRDECPWREVSRSEWRERARKLYERVAVFLCFVCKMYVCVECLSKHGGHEGMKVRREESEKKGFLARIKKGFQTAEREREKKERMRRKYIANVMNESERQRKDNFFSRRAIVCDRVEIKHELDRWDCGISGLCGLENKRLIVCDYSNYCIKIFKVGSHVLQRYIRFVESRPQDVTEIHLKQNSTEPNLVSGSSSDISATDRADPNKQCLIAVTLPGKRQIMFIDLSKEPAKPQKVIKTEEQCYDIQFYDDKIFTVCGEVRRDSPRYVYILSTDGETLNKIDTDIFGLRITVRDVSGRVWLTDRDIEIQYRNVEGQVVSHIEMKGSMPAGISVDPDIYLPFLAVVSGRVLLTDWETNKVHCRNVEGQVVSQITIKGSRPQGISVDPDNNVYVCGMSDNKVYQLDSDLTRYKSVLDQTAGYIKDPYALCCYRDKLYISHHRSPLDNFVTVVRLL